MEYEDMIDEDVDPKDGVEPIVVSEAIENTPARKTSPWKAMVLIGVLASLLGVGGGAYGVYAGLKAQSPDAPADTGLEVAKLTEPLTRKIKDLETRLAASETQTRKMENRPTPTSEPVDLSPLETRIAALETTANAEIDPAAITALQSAQADGFEWPDTSALETRLTSVETQVSDVSEAASPAVTLELLDRLDALEADVEAEKLGAYVSSPDMKAFDGLELRIAALENRTPTTAKIQRVSILAFPKSDMLNAIEDTAEGGFMKKALSKHIRVKDEDSPRSLIDGIEVDIAKGRLEAAATKFERLPAPVKAAGQAWYASVKASL